MGSRKAQDMELGVTVDDYLLAAWQRAAPGITAERFPTGFWPDVARAAVELAVAGDVNAPLSFRPTQCSNGGFEEPRKARGLDVSKLEFRL
jgi:hypothetical protein